MKRLYRRGVGIWAVRLLLGVALGWGVRMVYERRPLVRFASGMAVRSWKDGGTETAARGPHLQGGQPHFFSLDQIMGADDPAAALREWRDAFQAAPKDVQQRALQARAEVSLGSLRHLLRAFVSSASLREEMNSLLAIARDLGADLYDRDAALRGLMELARLDPALALDGAQAVGHADAVEMIWKLIAENTPQRLLEMARAGQAPAETLGLAVASLAARDLKQALAVIETLPEGAREEVMPQLAAVLARTRPLEALTLWAGPDGAPDPQWADRIIKAVPGPQALDFLLAVERQHPEMLTTQAVAVGELLQRQALREPGFVFQWLERHGLEKLNTDRRNELLAAIAPHDPAQAAKLVHGLAPSPDFESVEAQSSRFLRSTILTAWMRKDPMAALQWTTEQPNARQWLLGSLDWVDAVAPDQAPVLARWIAEQGLLQESSRLTAVTSLVKPWIRHDPEGAVDWAINLPPSNARTNAIGAAAEALARQGNGNREALIHKLIQSSPEALGPVIAHVDPEHVPLGDAVADALPQLLAQKGLSYRLEPRIAMHLAASVANPATRDHAIAALAALPDPVQRREFIEDVANRTTRERTLAVTRQLADALPDPESRQKFLESDLRQMFHR
jgi:hypothetical protein